MVDIHSVLKFVSLDASNEDLVKLVAAIKYRREDLSRRAKYSLKAGQAVTFSSRGVTYQGVVKSIKVKKATVHCTVPVKGFYNVPLDMLVAA